jgi:hypothetical protein
MSEFLSNLVARTLATAPVLQPRQPSLFEPDGGGWGLGNRDWGVVAEVETAVSTPHPPPASSAPARPVWPVTAAATPPPTTIVQPQPLPPHPRDAGSLAATQPERPPAARPEKKPLPTPSPLTLRERIIQQTVVEKKERLTPAAPSPAASLRPARAAAAPVPAVTPLLPTSSPPPSPTLERATDRPPAAPPIRPMTAVTKRPSVAEPAARTVKPERPLTTEPSPPPKTDNRQVVPPTPTLRERILPPAAMTPPQREQATKGRYQPDPPAPTIQVHIGRIEVRATPPLPQPAAKPRPQPATTSLDEYLRQRNGGRS